MTLHQILVILKARWLLCIGIFLGTVLLVLLITLIWPKQYTSIASVVIDAKQDPLAASGNAGGASQPIANYVNTQADIIASPRVAEQVVTTLRLDKQPAMQKRWPNATDGERVVAVADYLIKHKVLVAPTHDSPTHASNVIEIAVTWSDSKSAADIANAFAQTAIETNIDLKVEPAKQYATWFDQRSRALHSALEDKQKRLSDFQRANGIVATDEKLDVENARLTELSSQLVTIQGLRQESLSRQRQLGSDIESLPEVLQSPVIISLKSNLAQAEAKRQDITTRLGKNHPDYVEVEGEIANLRSRIAQESSSIAASLGSNTQVNVRRENDVRNALEAQKKHVLELRHQHDEASVLESDVTSAQKELDEVTQRLAQSSLESLTQQTNVVQLSIATPSRSPSSPQLVLNMLIAIFLGGVIAVGSALGIEMTDGRIREGADMADLLGIPVLGTIAPVVARSKAARLPPAAATRLDPSVI